jgi:integrase
LVYELSAGRYEAYAVNDWLAHGLSGRSEKTVDTYVTMCRKHLIPALGARRLRDLSAEDVDTWLGLKAKTLTTRSLQLLHSCLNRSVKRAMARDKVKRNVVELCGVPKCIPGRPSKALTLAQADAVLRFAADTRMRAYITVSLLIGARTEELRALTWSDVDLNGQPQATPPIPPHIAVWRSVRAGGDTKTRKSQRTLALPKRAVDALIQQREQQEHDRRSAAARWREAGLVFASKVGTELDAADVRRAFRNAINGAPDLNPDDWTPRELRHSFVSLPVQTTASRSRTSPGLSATAAQPSQSWSIASRPVPFSRRARSRWIKSSARPTSRHLQAIVTQLATQSPPTPPRSR